MPVPVENFGKDHWSTLLYVESRCVDYEGRPDRAHMRTDVDRHPHLRGQRNSHKTKYPTQIRDGVLPDHDDWDCVEDLIAAGFMEDLGTGVQPLWKLTPKGWKVAGALRQHRAKGDACATFRVKDAP